MSGANTSREHVEATLAASGFCKPYSTAMEMLIAATIFALLDERDEIQSAYEDVCRDKQAIADNRRDLKISYLAGEAKGWKDSAKAMRERCAKVADRKAEYHITASEHNLPVEPSPIIAKDRARAARIIAQSIRDLPLTEGKDDE